MNQNTTAPANHFDAEDAAQLEILWHYYAGQALAGLIGGRAMPIAIADAAFAADSMLTRRGIAPVSTYRTLLAEALAMFRRMEAERPDCDPPDGDEYEDLLARIRHALETPTC